MKKSVHVIGVAGKATAALAKMFKDMGWKVTGSDQEKIYDPARSYLKKNKIKVFSGYRRENLSPQAGLVIVGGSSLIMDRNNPEYLKAKRLKLPIMSQGQALAKFLIKKRSVCIAGTYGKTTTTALAAWFLKSGGKNPSYFIGEQTNNFPGYLEKNQSSLSIVEADEYAYRQIDFDNGPKFLNYPVVFAVITAALWEHKDVYKTEKDYIDAFIGFVKKIPPRGLLIANWRGENIKKVVRSANCPVQYYSGNRHDPVDWKLEKISDKGIMTEFIVAYKGKQIGFKTILIGQYNLENILAAIAIAHALGVDFKTMQKCLPEFKGVKRRLEFLGTLNQAPVYDDFAQSAVRVEAVLEAIKNKFPQKKILVIFDPHAGFLQKKKSLAEYKNAFAAAERIIIGRVTFKKNTNRQDRVTGSDFIRAINGRAEYIPIENDIIKKTHLILKPGWVMVFMSSGGLRGEKIKNHLLGK